MLFASNKNSVQCKQNKWKQLSSPQITMNTKLLSKGCDPAVSLAQSTDACNYTSQLPWINGAKYQNLILKWAM